MAEGGLAAALANVDDRDDWTVHFADTMRGGQYLNSWRMAELHAREAPARARELEAWGAVFDRTKDGRILQRNFGGHKYPRLAHVGDRTGLEMIRTLQDHGVHQGIDVHMECTVVELLKDGDRVVGAFGYDRERGRFQLFTARAVVLATGGIGRAYKVTSNSWEYTGDGHALAYRAGAELMDMEFVQFHPTGMVWPPSVRGILVTEGVRGEGGVLRNSEGKRFMFEDIPELYQQLHRHRRGRGVALHAGRQEVANRPPELLTRDHVARCIVREVKEGRGSPHGGVFLDIAWIKKRLPNGAEHIRKKLPSMYHQFKQLAGIDITEEPMEVGPTTHYVMGGARVDPDTQMSTVPGPVRGRRVRGGAARREPARRQLALRPPRLRPARRASTRPSSRRGRPWRSPRSTRSRRWRARPSRRSSAPARDAEGPYQVQYDLQDMMQSQVGIVRTEDDMQKAIDAFAGLRARADRVGVQGNREYNSGWHTAIDLRNLLMVSEAVARSAILRKESRGAHFREDHLEKDPEQGRLNTVIRRGEEGEMQVTQEPISEVRPDLQQIIEDNK